MGENTIIVIAFPDRVADNDPEALGYPFTKAQHAAGITGVMI